MDLALRTDAFIRKVLAEEQEEHLRLRRRFHLHCMLIGAGGFIVAGISLGIIPSDWVAAVAATEWARAGIDHRVEVVNEHEQD